MAKMTNTKKRKKGILPPRRDLTPNELTEVRELHRLSALEHFKAAEVKKNSSMVPDGQKYADQLESVARLVDQHKNNWMAQKFAECGFASGVPVTIDLATGKLTEGEAPKV